MGKLVVSEPAPLAAFTISLAGAEDAVREGIAQTLAQLAPLALSQDDAGTVQVILAEALNNVVEHALAATDGETRIEIRGKHNAKWLELIIIDEGAAMPEGVAPDPRPPEVDVRLSDLPEGGFGWFMIHTLAQEVSYVREGNCNHLTLRLAVGI